MSTLFYCHTFGINISARTTVVNTIIRPPKTAASVLKKRFSASAQITIAVIIMVDTYIIIVSCFESFKAFIVTFLVRNARTTATTWVKNRYARRISIHMLEPGPPQTRL